ncbi:MAG: zinc metallopeptidase [Coriobacteriia bacterium]|nr:zinc metallopeptidase [Coriobacteriia bacterium]
MYDYMYFVVLIASIVLGLGAQALINAQYSKYMKVPISTGLTGAQAARWMLDANGCSHIPIQMIQGKLSDNFDPRTGIVSLSEAVYNGRTVAATAIASHECGHAIQHATNYAPTKARTLLFPVVNIANNLWVIVLFMGFALAMMELIWLAVVMFSCVLLFQLITLPVELNASARASAYISMGGYLPEHEVKGTRRVLNAAAMTYVAGALVSVLQLLRILSYTKRR